MNRRPRFSNFNYNSTSDYNRNYFNNILSSNLPVSRNAFSNGSYNRTYNNLYPETRFNSNTSNSSPLRYNQNLGNLNYNVSPNSYTSTATSHRNVNTAPNLTNNTTNEPVTRDNLPESNNVTSNISGTFEVLGISGQDGNFRVVSRRSGNLSEDNLPAEIQNQMNRISERFLNYVNSDGLNIIELRENTTLETFQGEESSELCTICHEYISTNEIVRKINNCNHIFHQNCIDIWLESHSKCPLCRGQIANNISENTEVSYNSINDDTISEELLDNEDEIILEVEETDETFTSRPTTTPEGGVGLDTNPSPDPSTGPSVTNSTFSTNNTSIGFENVINTITDVVSNINTRGETDIIDTITDAINNINNSNRGNRK